MAEGDPFATRGAAALQHAVDKADGVEATYRGPDAHVVPHCLRPLDAAPALH